MVTARKGRGRGRSEAEGPVLPATAAAAASAAPARAHLSHDDPRLPEQPPELLLRALEADGGQNPHHEVSGCGEVRLRGQAGGGRARRGLLGPRGSRRLIDS